MGVSNNSLIVLAAFLVLSASSALGAPITCTYNFAASKVLCNAVSAPGRFTELGSPDGKFAFIVSDGAPRILKKAGNGTGKPGVVWQHANKIAVSYGCGAVYNTWFSQGSLQLTCGGVVYARLTASDGVSAARAKTITMDNNGTVYFVSPYGRVLTRLQGGSSANPGTVAFVKVKEPKQPPTVPSGDVAPLWVTMPDTWCNEIVWMRVHNGALQCEKNTAPNAAQNKDPIENCVYRHRCILNPKTLPTCDYGLGYIGNKPPGWRPKGFEIEWFTLIPKGGPLQYEKSLTDFFPVKEMGWLVTHNGSCKPYCPLPTIAYLLRDGKQDCGWEGLG